MVTELKTIPVEKILANFTQPREKFDKEKIQELAESILGNGLINPITVREYKKGYMIVAGERRWRAHKIAGLKTIQVFVKTYKDDGQMMIESLIENIHRENLNESERNKYLLKIKKITGWNNNQLAKGTGMNPDVLNRLFAIQETRKSLDVRTNKEARFGVIQETLSLPKEDRIKLIEKATKKDIGQRQIREEVKIIKQATPEVKKALLSDEITTDQAQRISKLKTEPERKQAIQQHKQLSKGFEVVEKRIEKNIEEMPKKKNDAEFKKKLLQAGNWIASFRGGVTDSYKSLEKTLKVLLISTKFIPMMDEKQKETLDQQLDRFLEILERAVQLTEQIQSKI